MIAMIDNGLWKIVKLVEAILNWRPRFILRRRFEEIFGFVPTEKGRVRKFEQDLVDKKLRDLAWSFDRYCKKEEELYRGQGGPDPLKTRDEILELRPQLEWAEAAFWRAWRFANRFGYKVENSFEAYLPASARRRAEATWR